MYPVTKVVMTVVVRRNRSVVPLDIGSYPILISGCRSGVMVLHGRRSAID